MPTRDHIVAAADQLFYRQGYAHTSFADIADVVQISRGNFYYHFKSKDEILDAVIEARLAATRAMLAQWERDSETPEDRIRSFIRMLSANRSQIKRYGCPVGTLCSELARLSHPSQAKSSRILTLYRTWLRQQFSQLGRGADADALALHLLVNSQGVATLAHAFHDAKVIREAVAAMADWLEGCTNIPSNRSRRPGRRATPRTRRNFTGRKQHR